MFTWFMLLVVGWINFVYICPSFFLFAYGIRKSFLKYVGFVCHFSTVLVCGL